MRWIVCIAVRLTGGFSGEGQAGEGQVGRTNCGGLILGVFGTKYRIYKEMFSYRLINILNVEDLQDYP